MLVLEREKEIGGNCDTFYFNAPAPNTPNWIDIGIRVYFDTKSLEAKGLGEYVFDMRHYLERFVGTENVYDITVPSLINYAADFTLGVNASNSPISGQSEEQKLALIRLLVFINRFPFLNNGNIPKDIPAELTVPFSQFIAEHNLQVLIPTIFRAISDYIGQSFDEIPTIHALYNLAPYQLALNAGEQNIGIGVNGGCQAFYNQVQSYIGFKQIKTDVQITGISRSNSKGYIRIEYTSNIEENDVHCRKLVMAIPPNLENLNFLDLTKKERYLFSHINVGHMYLFAVEVEGGIADTGFNNVINLNLSAANAPLNYPAITLLSRNLPYGPALGVLASTSPLNDIELNNLITTQLAGITFFNATLIPGSIDHHVHLDFDLASFRRSPFQRFEYLQGKLDTFWVGALNSFDYSHIILDNTYRLIQNNFPSKRQSQQQSQHQSPQQSPQHQAPAQPDYQAPSQQNYQAPAYQANSKKIHHEGHH